MLSDRLFIECPEKSVVHSVDDEIGSILNPVVNLYACCAFSTLIDDLGFYSIYFDYTDGQRRLWRFSTEALRNDAYQRLKRVYCLTQF